MPERARLILIRTAVWLLASSSFACLLGELYGRWSLRASAGWLLPPAIVLLAGIAWRGRGRPAGPGEPRSWIIDGAIGGVVAAVAYDLFRLPFVLAGYPLFAVFPRFGQLLLAADPADLGWRVQAAGWLFHFGNGAALGIMLLAMTSAWTRRRLIGGGMLWAAAVEGLLLLSPYYGYFRLELPFATFLLLTLSAHLIFGLVLGWWCWRRPGRRAIGR